MAQQYLLPCASCGETTPVESRQAGETVTCSCGTPISVPTLRGLRALETVNSSAVAAPAKKAWSPVQGILFSVGLLLAIAAGAMSALHFVNYSALQAHTSDRTPEVDASTNELIDKLSLTESIEAWEALNLHPPGADSLPPWVIARQMADAHFFSATIWLGVSCLGVTAVVVSLLLRPKAAPARARR